MRPHRFTKHFALVIALLSLSRAAPAAETGQHPQQLRKQIEVKLDYLLSLPEDYGKEQGKKWPMILFLHGAGERGDDVQLVTKHGPPKLLRMLPGFDGDGRAGEAEESDGQREVPGESPAEGVWLHGRYRPQTTSGGQGL